MTRSLLIISLAFAVLASFALASPSFAAGDLASVPTPTPSVLSYARDARRDPVFVMYMTGVVILVAFIIAVFWSGFRSLFR